MGEAVVHLDEAEKEIGVGANPDHKLPLVPTSKDLSLKYTTLPVTCDEVASPSHEKPLSSAWCFHLPKMAT